MMDAHGPRFMRNRTRLVLWAAHLPYINLARRYRGDEEVEMGNITPIGTRSRRIYIL